MENTDKFKGPYRLQRDMYRWINLDEQIVEARRVLSPQLYEEWLDYINQNNWCLVDYKHWLALYNVKPQ